MDVFEAIHTRRSIRKYKDRPVPQELVTKILRAAMSAPSAVNAQPWVFIVIDDRKLLDEIPTFSPYAGMCREAPLAILVCGDITLEKAPGYWVQDCSAATQNLLLAAHAAGLGAVWTGIYPMKDRIEGFRKAFELPEHVIPLALVPIGYPNQRPEHEDRYREEKVYHNKYGRKRMNL
ncbi:Nitroreductase [Methanosarcina thermophila]|jgi:nitroreductase|uniref:NADPH-flavin oxidoreductase n=3 Tax=Methanosarcina thermophila TaxID=2210 RepID=A0A1I6YNU6_METTE|nr:nitroreductase family protein [Methanosarcina thermophila]ALK05176.1 MAG: NADH dehydrogenase [Methanosarcina sp. 795]AKB13934.1 Nitroreductase family protein [Methanosarcina thermophila TM-1]AKB15421.1 Nitroreductase family protein [Methanosarcina thermophila CHTI-55]NLU55996.1 nitroreductase family protein [Methanosarcina thermophila]SFT52127.1 Nitroreductase [Methanosarcina thermophila]